MSSHDMEDIIQSKLFVIPNTHPDEGLLLAGQGNFDEDNSMEVWPLEEDEDGDTSAMEASEARRAYRVAHKAYIASLRKKSQLTVNEQKDLRAADRAQEARRIANKKYREKKKAPLEEKNPPPSSSPMPGPSVSNTPSTGITQSVERADWPRAVSEGSTIWDEELRPPLTDREAAMILLSMKNDNSASTDPTDRFATISLSPSPSDTLSAAPTLRDDATTQANVATWRTSRTDKNERLRYNETQRVKRAERKAYIERLKSKSYRTPVEEHELLSIEAEREAKCVKRRAYNRRKEQERLGYLEKEKEVDEEEVSPAEAARLRWNEIAQLSCGKKRAAEGRNRTSRSTFEGQQDNTIVIADEDPSPDAHTHAHLTREFHENKLVPVKRTREAAAAAAEHASSSSQREQRARNRALQKERDLLAEAIRESEKDAYPPAGQVKENGMDMEMDGEEDMMDVDQHHNRSHTHTRTRQQASPPLSPVSSASPSPPPLFLMARKVCGEEEKEGEEEH